eukprot:15330433-Ditylum_brightwellii.AAC.1
MPQLTYEEMKSKTKTALKTFAKSNFTIEDLEKGVKPKEIKVISTIHNLLLGEKTVYDKSTLPMMYKVLHSFCVTKSLYRATFNKDDFSRESKANLSAMTGIKSKFINSNPDNDEEEGQTTPEEEQNKSTTGRGKLDNAIKDK